MEYAETVSDEDDGALGIGYRLHFPQTVTLNGYQVSFNLGLDAYQGATIELETPQGAKTLTIPAELSAKAPFSGPVTGLRVAPGTPRGFSLSVDQPTNLLVQDNRGWAGDTFELRFNFRRQELGEQVAAGETIERQFALKADAPLQVGQGPSRRPTLDWVPHAPLGQRAGRRLLSTKPAGKFGLYGRDGRFASQTRARSALLGHVLLRRANFPSHEQSEMIARRQPASASTSSAPTMPTPSGPRGTSSEGMSTTPASSMPRPDRFDYDLLPKQDTSTSRPAREPVQAGDGVDAVDSSNLREAVLESDPKLIELQNEFKEPVVARTRT